MSKRSLSANLAFGIYHWWASRDLPTLRLPTDAIFW